MSNWRRAICHFTRLGKLGDAGFPTRLNHRPRSANTAFQGTSAPRLGWKPDNIKLFMSSRLGTCHNILHHRVCQGVGITALGHCRDWFPKSCMVFFRHFPIDRSQKEYWKEWQLTLNSHLSSEISAITIPSCRLKTQHLSGTSGYLVAWCLVPWLRLARVTSCGPTAALEWPPPAQFLLTTAPGAGRVPPGATAAAPLT